MSNGDSTKTRHLDALVEEGARFYERGHYRAALNLWKKVLSEEPGHQAALNWLDRLEMELVAKGPGGTSIELPIVRPEPPPSPPPVPEIVSEEELPEGELMEALEAEDWVEAEQPTTGRSISEPPPDEVLPESFGTGFEQLSDDGEGAWGRAKPATSAPADSTTLGGLEIPPPPIPQQAAPGPGPDDAGHETPRGLPFDVPALHGEPGHDPEPDLDDSVTTVFVPQRTKGLRPRSAFPEPGAPMPTPGPASRSPAPLPPPVPQQDETPRYLHTMAMGTPPQGIPSALSPQADRWPPADGPEPRLPPLDPPPSMEPPNIPPPLAGRRTDESLPDLEGWDDTFMVDGSVEQPGITKEEGPPEEFEPIPPGLDAPPGRPGAVGFEALGIPMDGGDVTPKGIPIPEDPWARQPEDLPEGGASPEPEILEPEILEPEPIGGEEGPEALEDGLDQGDAGPGPETPTTQEGPREEAEADPVDRAVAALERGDLAVALASIREALVREPGSARVQELYEGTIDRIVKERMGLRNGRDAVLRPRISQAEIMGLHLDAKTGFLLYSIDGHTSIDELMDLSAMEPLETLEALATLVEQGVVEEIG